MRLRRYTGILGAAFGALLAGAVHAADPVEQHNSSAFWFINWIGLSNATLDVVAPNGEIMTVFAASGTPVFELDRGKAIDGVYRYQLSAATEKRIKVVNQLDSGRGENASDTAAEGFYTTGQFHVSRGVIITPETITEDSN